jgi:hypothetical protein
VLIDETGYPVSSGYRLTNVPSIFLIDSDAAIRATCMGFSKADLENIANELAGRRKQMPAALFRPDERVPDYKPG